MDILVSFVSSGFFSHICGFLNLTLIIVLLFIESKIVLIKGWFFLICKVQFKHQTFYLLNVIFSIKGMNTYRLTFESIKSNVSNLG